MIGIFRTRAGRLLSNKRNYCEREENSGKVVERCPCGKLLLRVEVEQPGQISRKPNDSHSILKSMTKSPNSCDDSETQELSCSSISSKGTLQRGTEHIQLRKLCLSCSKNGNQHGTDYPTFVYPSQEIQQENELSHDQDQHPDSKGSYMPPREIYLVERHEQEQDSALMTPCHSNLSSNRHVGNITKRYSVCQIYPSPPRRPTRTKKSAFSFDLHSSDESTTAGDSKQATRTTINTDSKDEIENSCLENATVSRNLKLINPTFIEEQNVRIHWSRVQAAQHLTANIAPEALNMPSTYALCSSFVHEVVPTYKYQDTEDSAHGHNEGVSNEEEPIPCSEPENAALSSHKNFLSVRVNMDTKSISKDNNDNQFIEICNQQENVIVRDLDELPEDMEDIRQNKVSASSPVIVVAETHKKCGPHGISLRDSYELGPAPSVELAYLATECETFCEHEAENFAYEHEAYKSGKIEVLPAPCQGEIRASGVPTNSQQSTTNSQSSDEDCPMESRKTKFFQTQLSSLIQSESFESLTDDAPQPRVDKHPTLNSIIHQPEVIQSQSDSTERRKEGEGHVFPVVEMVEAETDNNKEERDGDNKDKSQGFDDMVVSDQDANGSSARSWFVPFLCAMGR